MHRVYLLSPAHCGGIRAQLVLREQAAFPLAMRLRSRKGVAIGEVFAFISGLYFRGKLAYARAFARPPRGVKGAYVITTDRGLVPVEKAVTRDDLLAMAAVDLHHANDGYRTPLERDAKRIAARVGPDDEVVLLGSVAHRKYLDVLEPIFGARLKYPAEFVGRGDMSRGGLMLRCVDAGEPLAYESLGGRTRHGARPPKLAPRVRTKSGTRRPP